MYHLQKQWSNWSFNIFAVILVLMTITMLGNDLFNKFVNIWAMHLWPSLIVLLYINLLIIPLIANSLHETLHSKIPKNETFCGLLKSYKIFPKISQQNIIWYTHVYCFLPVKFLFEFKSLIFLRHYFSEKNFCIYWNFF